MANELVECVVRANLHGSIVCNVLHFRHAPQDPIDDWPAKLNQLTAAIIACVKTVLLPGLSNEIAYQDIYAAQIAPVLGPVTTTAFGENNAGQVVGQSLPGVSCITINKRANIRGRRNRGSFRLSGIAENDSQQGKADADLMVIIAAFLACMAGKFIGDDRTTDWQLVIHGKEKKNDQNVVIQQAHTIDVVTMDASSVLGTQVTRKVGRGM